MFTNTALGKQIYHNEHEDDDYEKSAVVFLNNVDDVRTLHDNLTVHYFTFPTLGLAVALRVGDVLFWNPQHPHAVSSIACNMLGKLYGILFYNKTRIVGENDNRKHNTEKELFLSKKFESNNNN